MKRSLKIGTRGSKLALWQARHVAELLRKHHPDLTVDLEIIKTKGDELVDVKLTPELGRSFFVKEIEDALLSGSVDLAVHSLKDLGTTMPEGLMLGAVPERASPHDCLVSMTEVTLETLPRGARVATSSLRRKAQLRSTRPDIEMVDIRGNLDTRVGKLKAGNYDALVLAEAGLDRMAIEGVHRCRLETDVMMPAVGQGALGLQIRSTDADLAGRLQALEHPDTRAAVDTERAFLRMLEAGCQVPAGALAVVRKKTVRVSAVVADPAGRRMLRAEDKGTVEDAAGIGRRLAERMLEMGAKSLMAASRAGAVILLAACLALAGEARAQAPSPASVTSVTEITGVRIGSNHVKVETVDDEASRARGLMHRKEMPEDHGMLFVFQQPHRLSFWMKNTHLPLSIAFMDEAGVILNIRDMKPLDEGPRYTSRGKALYALEVNQGWFDRHGVKAGDKVEFLWTTRETR